MQDLPQTPAVIIDVDIAKRNIRRFQDFADQHGFAVRPHIKTHKLPQMAELQLEAGAVGITCQKVSEAMSMAEASDQIQDILITYNILGDEKLAMLVELARKVRLSVVADSAVVVEGLSRAFADAGLILPVLVECNTGADRCGVAAPQLAADLAKRIARAEGRKFGGRLTYPPVGGQERVQSFMSQAKALIEAASIPVQRITTGGTPDMMTADRSPIATEFRPGTYIYNDRSLVMRGVCAWDDCALAVHTTVVSVPAPNRAVIDAGSKSLTSDLLGLTGYGHVLGRDDIVIDQLSEEHGRLVSEGPINLQVGDRLRIIPNHACVVTNMTDYVYIVSAGQPVQTWPVVARGRVL